MARLIKQQIQAQFKTTSVEADLNDSPIYIETDTASDSRRKYTITQADLTVANLWVVNHNMGKPVRDSSVYANDGVRVYASEENLGLNAYQIDFSCFTPLAGSYEITLFF